MDPEGYTCPTLRVRTASGSYRADVDFMIVSIDDTIRERHLAYLCSDPVTKITCQVGARLISRLWLRTPC